MSFTRPGLERGGVYEFEGRPARRANRAELDHAKRLKRYVFNQESLTQEQVMATIKARKHKATYSTDKRSGGYLIRVQGPNADRFAGRDVPVTLKNGSEHTEQLDRMIWVGVDKDSGEKVALYKFTSKPREDAPVEFD